MLFGEQAYEELRDLVEIIVENNAGPQVAVNVMERVRRNPPRNGPNLRNDMANIVKLALAGAGVSGAVVGQLTKGVYNWAKEKTKESEDMRNNGEDKRFGPGGRLSGSEITKDENGNIIDNNLGKRLRSNSLASERGDHQRRVNEEGQIGKSNPGHRSSKGDELMERPGGDDGGDAQMAMARVGGNDGGGNQVSKETPISNYPSLSYGLQETHTTILPYTCWMGAAGLGKGLPARIDIRTNTPWEIIPYTFPSVPGANGVYSGPTMTISGVDWQGRRALDFADFPQNLGNNNNERPAWRDYWAQYYEYYTVLSTEYEIIVHNPTDAAYLETIGVLGETTVNYVYKHKLKGDVVIGEQMDSYSDTQGASGNKMPTTTFYETKQYKNIKWHHVSDRGGKTIIRGTVKPGMIKRNVSNDGDVKTWTKINPGSSGTQATGELPTLKEFLTLSFWADPLNTSQLGITGGAITNGCGCNIEINMKYIVQFKDLRLQARYPNSAITDQDITATLNESATAPGSALQYW